MGKKKKIISKNVKSPAIKKISREKKASLLPWILLAMGVTAICLSPMLRNGFTNWDDDGYVVANRLLRGPDWTGIFSQPVVGNWHPLTIASLAINYGISGTDAWSYLLFNFLLHLVNTALVFYFIWLISGQKTWVAFFTALVFGIHPMHVESVAWVSERKDVLYTLFFLLSLIQYWRFLEKGRRSNYWLCFLFFLLSLLSKPAAIVLTLVLLLLDYWKGRPINRKAITEKIIFFILSVIFGIVVLKIQSQTAVAGLALYSMGQRILFACYVVMIYAARFFVPQPLSAFHPYPIANNLGAAILLSPLFIVGLAAVLFWFRKNKLIVFSLLFFLVNLLLVMQIVSIGSTIVSERYTYVPYIGLAFLFGSLLYTATNRLKMLRWVIAAIVAVSFGVLTFQRTQVWKDSGRLWDDAISHYPKAPDPHLYRAYYNYHRAIDPAHAYHKDSLLHEVVNDCNFVISINPNVAGAHETRGVVYFLLGQDSAAFADALALKKLDPNNKSSYTLPGTYYLRHNEPQKALAEFTKCLSLYPDDDYSLNRRGTLLMSDDQKKYAEALNDFSRAITINPQGLYYLNRSFCYLKLGNIANARSDEQTAERLGTPVPDSYKEKLK